MCLNPHIEMDLFTSFLSCSHITVRVQSSFVSNGNFTRKSAVDRKNNNSVKHMKKIFETVRPEKYTTVIHPHVIINLFTKWKAKVTQPLSVMG